MSASRRVVYFKLMEKVQEFDPFKLILYAGQIDTYDGSPICDCSQFCSPTLPTSSICVCR